MSISYIVEMLGLAIKPINGKNGVKFQSVRFHLSQREAVSSKLGQMLDDPIRQKGAQYGRKKNVSDNISSYLLLIKKPQST